MIFKAWFNKQANLFDMTGELPQYIPYVEVRSIETERDKKAIVMLVSIMPNEWLAQFNAKTLAIYASNGTRPDVIEDQALRFRFSNCKAKSSVIEDISWPISEDLISATMLYVTVEADVEMFL